jgi:hypothetical protein
MRESDRLIVLSISLFSRQSVSNYLPIVFFSSSNARISIEFSSSKHYKEYDEQDRYIINKKKGCDFSFQPLDTFKNLDKQLTQSC